jgi:hypothetical protein
MLIPLKQKYLEANRGRFKSKSSNRGEKNNSENAQGRAHRRNSYGPWWYHVWGSQLPLDPTQVRDIIERK